MSSPIPELDPALGGIDPAEWPLIADAAFNRRASSGYLETRMHVRRHADGRLLVYCSIKDGAVVTPMGGSISKPRNDEELKRQLVDAVSALRGHRELVETCQKQIAQQLPRQHSAPRGCEW